MQWKRWTAWRRVTLVDGTRCRLFEKLMRRQIKGQWQYRRLTGNERAADFAAGVW